MSSSEWFKFNPVFNSKWAITQDSLKELLGLKDRAEKFIKVAEVAFYSYDQLPTKYKDIVWKLDNATYTEEQLKNYLVAYQRTKDWNEDLYLIPREEFEKKYKIINTEKQVWISEIQPLYIAVKNIPVYMLKSKDYLGIFSWQIEAPWGGTQDFNENSFLVLWDWEVYICQMDESIGYPIGYIPYEEKMDKIVGNTIVY